MSITVKPWGCQAMAANGGPLLGGSSQGTKHVLKDLLPTPWEIQWEMGTPMWKPRRSPF